MSFLILLSLLAVVSVLLIRVWTGVMRRALIEEESLAAIEKQHPYLPGTTAIVISALVGGVLFYLALKFGTKTSLQSLWGKSAVIRTIIVFCTILAFGFFDRLEWKSSNDRFQYFYAFVLGTVVSWILIAAKRALFETGLGDNPFLLALGFVCLVLGWKFLFSSWKPSIKVTVLGSFLFWVSYVILRAKEPDELLATSIAAAIALVPVAVWCSLFLRYHKERFSIVLLAFFAGMLSTVPILFYYQLTGNGTDLNFFFFRISPESFGVTSGDFVKSVSTGAETGLTVLLLGAFVRYMLVGVIEELSKFWVLQKSGKQIFRSVDDAMQLAIIVALGFAFAENIVNPTYFVSFVEDYLLTPDTPQWGPLFAGVLGRGVLTIMVHVLSTGVLGYYFGLAFFAPPLLRDRFERGKIHPILYALHRMLGIRTETLYARMQLTIGLILAILLHGMFDFIVTIPSLLPGNPQTLGDIFFPDAEAGVLHSVSITLVPSLFYIVGGFWLLTSLFERSEDMKERGSRSDVQTFVTE